MNCVTPYAKYVLKNIHCIDHFLYLDMQIGQRLPKTIIIGTKRKEDGLLLNVECNMLNVFV